MPLLETLTDDFTTLDTTKWPTRSAGAVSVVGGQLQVISQAGTANYNTCRSQAIWTAANSYALAQVTPAAMTGSNSQATYLSVDRDSSNNVFLLRDSNGLSWGRNVNGTNTSTVIGAYNATTMAWWRIRHNGTAFVFGYSADGLTWTEPATWTPTWAVTDTMTVTFWCGKWATADPQATALFDNLNLPPAPAAQSVSPAGIAVAAALDNPTVSFTAASWTGTASPTGIAVSLALDAPAVAASGGATTPGSYGAGDYGVGSYGGAATKPTPVANNLNYGDGVYGAGPYFGVAIPTLAADLFPTDEQRTAQHILGIGPWNPTVLWRGVKNYGIGAGRRPARPVMRMPRAESKSFTLRLNEAGEATAAFRFTRDDAVIIEEMSTDVWWRRFEPRTGKVEMIGRFNADKNDLSATGTELSSSVHFVDYRQILSDRLLLKYKNAAVDPPETMWPKGTPVTEIMRFAVPTNTGINITALNDNTLLGVTTAPFHVGPGTAMSELFTNLLAVSPKPWEWWVEQPDALDTAPTLKFAVSERGQDRNVVLFDHGTGVGPIARWSMIADADQYANSLYFTGGTGGVHDIIPSQVDEYGQRDATDSDSTLGGALDAIKKAAVTKLRQLADRRPTFQVTLRTGFWRGPSHINVGDTVRLNLRVGRELIDHRYRVSELQCDIDSVGTETVTLTLGTPLASADPRSRRSPLIRIVRKLKNYTPPDGS